jgi:hypothetical protein
MRLTLLALAAFTAFAFADAPNTLTADEQAAGWKLLFDGKTTAGWRGIGKSDFPAKGWVVEDGVLRHIKKGGGGDIVTSEDYESFELTWEWKIGQAGNSGVKYNLPDPEQNIGCEYQLIDDEKHPDGLRGGKSHQTAGLYDLIAPADRKTNAVGEWNSSRLIVEGNHVEHWLNGVKTVEFEFGSEALKALIAKSKYKKVPGFGEKKKSPILLQDHEDEISFRSIKLRVLK